MANISQQKRDKMLAFLEKLKLHHSDDETMMAINEIENELTSKKYGLVWEEHSEQVDEMLTSYIPVLSEIQDRKILVGQGSDRIGSDRQEYSPFNFLIQGDNLHSLKILEKTHRNKIDVIYIDPPYNTGNKDFIYNDNYVDSNDGYRHSKWLSFMSKRLEIAKNLLSQTGVIFISIDDNEQAQLKLLCDEVFGEQNFLAQIIPIANPGGRDYKDIAITHEYMLVYSKKGMSTLNEISKDIEFKNIDSKGGYELRELRNRNPKFNSQNRPNLFYPIYVSPNTKDKYNCNKISIESTDEYCIPVFPYNSKGEKSVWRWSIKKLAENLSEMIDTDEVVARQKKDGNWNIYEKSRKITTKAKSVWSETEMRTEEGTRLINKLFDKTVFNHPKSLHLVKRAVFLGSRLESTILDFFAGSGTTGHAVAQLNKEDGGNRRYILCTNNENNICEEVTYQRLKNIQTDLPHNLKYLKTDFIPRFSEDDIGIKQKLMFHIKELIELEYGCEIDNVHNFFIQSEEELDQLLTENLTFKARLFVAPYILLNQAQNALIHRKQATVINIPDYYFRNELVEVGEL